MLYSKLNFSSLIGLTAMLVAFGVRLLLYKHVPIIFIILISVGHGDASVTSAFIRSEWPSVDIPLENEAFAIPKGHNAPQQVSLYLC